MVECSSWTATAMRADEHGLRELTVSGECEAPSTGFRLSLRYTNPGINPDETLVVLDLDIEAPEVGAAVMTPMSVRFATEVGGQRTHVSIRNQGVMIPIEEVA